VLSVRCRIYVAAEKWDYVAEVANSLCMMLPDFAFGPLHLAHALRKLDRPKETRDTLLPVADKFPTEWRIPYQLSCYTCRLGDLKEAYEWMEKAIDLAGKTDIRLKALDDPDLEPLWTQIGEI
jgi:hypothetical protein